MDDFLALVLGLIHGLFPTDLMVLPVVLLPTAAFFLGLPVGAGVFYLGYRCGRRGR